MTPAIASAMHELERVADQHRNALFTASDVDAALALMTTNTTLRHLPAGTGAAGHDAVRRFYAEDLLPCLPADLTCTRVSRTVGRFGLVDEMLIRFTHDQSLPWLLPGVEPTGRRAEVTAIVIAEFDRLRIKAQRIHWDHATLLSQLALPPNP